MNFVRNLRSNALGALTGLSLLGASILSPFSAFAEEHNTHVLEELVFKEVRGFGVFNDYSSREEAYSQISMIGEDGGTAFHSYFGNYNEEGSTEVSSYFPSNGVSMFIDALSFDTRNQIFATSGHSAEKSMLAITKGLDYGSQKAITFPVSEIFPSAKKVTSLFFDAHKNLYALVVDDAEESSLFYITLTETEDSFTYEISPVAMGLKIKKLIGNRSGTKLVMVTSEDGKDTLYLFDTDKKGSPFAIGKLDGTAALGNIDKVVCSLDCDTVYLTTEETKELHALRLVNGVLRPVAKNFGSYAQVYSLELSPSGRYLYYSEKDTTSAKLFLKRISTNWDRTKTTLDSYFEMEETVKLSLFKPDLTAEKPAKFLGVSANGRYVYLAHSERLNDEKALLEIIPTGTKENLVIDSATPNQNSFDVLDVNRDGSISPMDALAVINFLNTYGASDLSLMSEESMNGDKIDVSGDNFVSPLDAILVLNYLNSQNSVRFAEDDSAEGEHLDYSFLDRIDNEALMYDFDSVCLALSDEGRKVPQDLDTDGAITQADFERLLTLYKRKNGDVTGDGKIDSSDIVVFFTAGKYERDVLARWSEGDVNCDGRFDSQDLVVLMQQGGE